MTGHTPETLAGLTDEQAGQLHHDLYEQAMECHRQLARVPVFSADYDMILDGLIQAERQFWLAAAEVNRRILTIRAQAAIMSFAGAPAGPAAEPARYVYGCPCGGALDWDERARNATCARCLSCYDGIDGLVLVPGA